MNFTRLVRGIEIMGRNVALDDQGIEDALTSADYSAQEARLLITFVPSAFARPVLERLGVEHFVETVSAPKKGGGWVDVPLKNIPVFCNALALVRGHPSTKLLEPEHFRSLAMRSAEVDMANNALNAGADLKGATSASALIGVTAEDLGYGSWISRLRRRFAV
jgi:hypothetical protein